MNPTESSAPGKLILIGEHAAVFGQPALVAAVDLRLTAALEPSATDDVLLRLVDIGCERRTDWQTIHRWTRESRARWQIDPATAWSAEPWQLAGLALGETARAIGSDPGGLTLIVRSELPSGGGLGSSAALSVAVSAGLLALSGEPADVDRVERIAMEVERRQHGTPSGIDAATIVHGGLLRVQRSASGEVVREPVSLRAGALNTLTVYDSGRPAEHTGQVVSAVRRGLERSPAGIRSIERLGALTDALATALGAAPGSAAMEIGTLIRESESLLEQLGVVPPAVRSVCRAVEARGGAAKISGAGALSGEGAGCVLVHHPDPAAVEPAIPPGWRVLDARLAGDGLRWGSA